MPLPLTVSCFSKIQIGFTFLVLAHPGSPGKRAVKQVCVCVRACVRACVCVLYGDSIETLSGNRDLSMLSCIIDRDLFTDMLLTVSNL